VGTTRRTGQKRGASSPPASGQGHREHPGEQAPSGRCQAQCKNPLPQEQRHDSDRVIVQWLVPIADREVDAMDALQDRCTVVPVARFVMRQARGDIFKPSYTQRTGHQQQERDAAPPEFCLYVHRGYVTAEGVFDKRAGRIMCCGLPA